MRHEKRAGFDPALEAMIGRDRLGWGAKTGEGIRRVAET